jgi:hypothetical protein
MLRAVFLGALALACAFAYSLLFSIPSWSAGLHPRCNIDWPCVIATGQKVKTSKAGLYDRIARADRYRNLEFGVPIYPPETAARWLAGTPRYIAGRLKCAVNVNAALAARGIRGTGSALAKSFLSWGRASGPTLGAVAVFSRGRRGGHVAIVHDVRPDGTVIYLNPSSRRQAWQVGPYGKRPIAFRVAG